MRVISRLFLGVALVMGFVLVSGVTGPDVAASDHCRYPKNWDADNNGVADAGVTVNCNYQSVYAYDASGAYYWDLGDGRVYGVASIDALDQSTLSVCDYQVHSKGDFGNTPFLDSGVITNNIHCSGHDGNASYYYQIVSSDDPRYTGDPDWAEFGTWEYHVYTVSGEGNLVAKPATGNDP